MSEPTPTPPPAQATQPTAPQPPVASAPVAPSRPPRPKRPFQARPVSKVPTLENTEDLSSRAPSLRDLDAQVQNELEAALAGFDEQNLLSAGKPDAEKAAVPAGQPGRKRGRVISIHGDDVFVEIPGGRGQGVLSLEQFDDLVPAIGTEVDVEIEGYDGANGVLLLTRLGAVQVVDWSSVEVGQIVEARVTETNKGGLSVEVNGIRGFMPISQIDLYRVENTEQFVNQKLRCMVTEVNPAERNLVISRRAMLERERDEQKETFWDGLAVGQTRTGMVRSILPFGAFVNLGPADGLIPVSELSWTRVEKPEDVVKEGQSVEVKIIKLDRPNHKIALSLKQLQASPWDTLEQRFYPGLVFETKITRLADFGAFVQIEPGIEGLVHVSEIALQRIRKPGAVVQPGQLVKVKVLSIDKENRRMSLSIKQAFSQPEEVVTETESAEADAPVKPRRRNPNLRGGVGGGMVIPGGSDSITEQE
jgi:small subunit ribosomal protein S1